jgi:hypothetical protein
MSTSPVRAEWYEIPPELERAFKSFENLESVLIPRYTLLRESFYEDRSIIHFGAVDIHKAVRTIDHTGPAI